MQKSNEVIYQIFPRNHSLEGKFKNITADLPRLKELGVDIIYLMPINEIGRLNRKGIWGSPYASKDYYSISSDLGTLDDFHILCQKTHELGMKIIIDMVFNHTAPDNVLIKQHPDYYFYKSGKLGNRIGDWSDIVDLDVDKEETQNYLVDVLKYWVSHGVDGFRFDVATMIPLSFFKKARKKLGKKCIFLAESVDTSFYNWLVSQGFYATKDEDMIPTFDSLYNYHWFRQFEGYLKYGNSLKELANVLNQPSAMLRANCLENHDNDRIAHLMQNDEGRIRNALAFSFFLPGCPFIYAGQEYGIAHKPELFEKDPVNWGEKNESIYQFVKFLIALKHQDSDSQIDRIKATLIGKDALKIEKANAIGLFNFGNKEISVDLGNDKYINLLEKNKTYSQKISLAEPLILERVAHEN
ncbi:MAG TPA: alpha-amylase family glycosyl hydrolase [Bacilli bacterium]|nr:alpha-amylase family glycosyl hydrolase [Bacilli bacterium]HPS18945.1 alpha-amylase family glycosyl hydrolase [Bacilli bacterium]